LFVRAKKRGASNPDYAIKSDHTHSIRSKSAISKKLVVNKNIIYRSVKNSHLAALKNQENQHFRKGCKMTVFNGKKFSNILNAKSGSKSTLISPKVSNGNVSAVVLKVKRERY
jgi:hypothetical protein